MQELIAQKEKKTESNMMEVNVECFNILRVLLSLKTLYNALC